MVNTGMNRKLLLVALLFTILCTGSFAVFTKTPPTTQTSSVANDTNGKLDSKVLGDVENTITTPIRCLDIEYLEGFIWAAELNGDLYKLNPTTGAEVLHYALPFEPAGLATDGTFFYISVYSSTLTNGTIFKYTMDGILVASLNIAIPNDFIAGLAYDEWYLYAVLEASSLPSNILYRINLDSWSVDGSVPLSYRYGGLTYYDGLLWAVAWQADEIHALDPDTGSIREVFDGPVSGFGDYGMAYNGTHFIVSDHSAQKLYFLDIPTDTGDVWNQYASPDSQPLDLAWNGTNYFLSDSNLDRVYILDDRTFKTITQFNLPFHPLGIAVVGNYLYISQENTPYSLYKYTQKGSLVATYAVAHSYASLEYDGSKLWGTDYSETFIHQIDPSDGHIIASYNATVNYAGLVFDSKNNAFWAVDWWPFASRIFQLNPTTFQKTGVEYLCPTATGSYGLEFNGEHLILTSWDSDAIYKIIIAFPLGGIPGFTDMFLIFSIMAVVSIMFLLRQARTYLRTM